MGGRVSRLNAVDTKDPSESKTYSMDWSPQLNSGATISTSTWTLPSALTAIATATSGAVTSVLLSGGNDGQDYECLNTITTSDSETLTKAGTLRVRRADRLSR
jgi:hypothetical protein